MTKFYCFTEGQMKWHLCRWAQARELLWRSPRLTLLAWVGGASQSTSHKMLKDFGDVPLFTDRLDIFMWVSVQMDAVLKKPCAGILQGGVLLCARAQLSQLWSEPETKQKVMSHDTLISMWPWESHWHKSDVCVAEWQPVNRGSYTLANAGS